MSAIEQPAARSGSTTCWRVAVRMSALSAMKCTPQNTMYSALRPGGGLLRELERVAGHVGELDDLVALVVVAEHEGPVAQRRLGRPRALDQGGVGGGGQLAGAVDAALAVRVGLAAEQQQRERRRRHAGRQVEVRGHLAILSVPRPNRASDFAIPQRDL